MVQTFWVNGWGGGLIVTLNQKYPEVLVPGNVPTCPKPECRVHWRFNIAVDLTLHNNEMIISFVGRGFRMSIS